MALDEISASYASVFAAMRAKTGNSDQGNSAAFATFLPDETARAARAPAPQSDMMSRILQVGMVGYVKEQKEVDRIMTVLSLVSMESDGEVRAELDKLIKKFKEEPPLNGEDALNQIKEHIDAMPMGDLKLRMLKTLERIKELMALPDEALERMEKELQANKTAATANVFAANDAT